MGDKFDPKCHIGETHGIYTIVDVLDKKDKYGHWIYKCVCNECGFEKEFRYGAISGKYKTTICKHLKANGEYITNRCTWKNQRLRRIFKGMISRCYNKGDKDCRWYGAKSIRICEQWLNNPNQFEEWALLNGYTDDLTIDRIDSDKHYCPENCRWIFLVENTRRAGAVNWIEVDGKNMTGRQWSNYFNIGINAINKCVKKYGIDKTKELILAMLKEFPSTKCRKPHQTWFEVYGIQI